MRKTALRQLEVLETEERIHQQKHQSSLGTTGFLCCKVLLAHYLGGLKAADEDPGEAEARALEYESKCDYLNALFSGEIADIKRRFKRAVASLFGQLGLNDRSPPTAFSEAFPGLVKDLPEQWLQWIEANSLVSRKSRVFSQNRDAAFGWIAFPDHLLLHLLQREEAKVCFWAFRRYMHQGMKVGWWQYEVANELESSYYRLKKRERPNLGLMAPPQHGKTELLTDFIAWVAGKDPELKTIFASYSDELGIAVNTALQRIMSRERYVAMFGKRLGESRSRWARNSNTLEYPNHRGSFCNTTVGGQITGKGLDLAILDDPIKGRAEASSKTVRDKLWNWITDDFFTRFSDSAGLIMIMTRWHVDDPVGRFIER